MATKIFNMKTNNDFDTLLKKGGNLHF